MLIRLIKKWYTLLLSVFWARKCAGCGQIAEEGLFCSVCREALLQPLWLTGHETLDGAGMLLRYNGALKTALQKVKFNSRRDVLELLAEEYRQFGAESWPAELQDILSTPGIIIVPIPTSAQRASARGFDIPLVLFAHPADGYCLTQALARTRETMPQYDLIPRERKINLEACFEVIQNVAGKTVIVVDDIFTTGATMEEAAKALKDAGAIAVYGLALCGSIENYGPGQ